MLSATFSGKYEVQAKDPMLTRPVKTCQATLHPTYLARRLQYVLSSSHHILIDKAVVEDLCTHSFLLGGHDYIFPVL